MPLLPAAVAERRTLRIVLFCLALILALSFILIFEFLPSRLTLEVGDVSPRDIRSPSRITYVSDVETEAARQRAERSVSDIYDYDPTDTTIARGQIEHARRVFDYVASVRHDPYASAEQKEAMLTAISGVDLPPMLAADSVTLEEEEWDQVVARTIAVLGEVMDQEIRPEQVEEVRQTLHVFEPELTDLQADLVEAWAAGFVVPNSFPDTQATADERARARQAVEPVSVTLEEGEIIIREGQVVSPLAREALVKLRLLQPRGGWMDVGARVLFVSLMVSVLALYLTALHPRFWANWRDMLLLGLLVSVGVLLAKLMIPGHVILGYLFPAAAVSMLMTALVDAAIAIVLAAILSPIIGLVAGGSLEFAIYSLAGAAVASLRLHRIERLNSFLWAGLYCGLSNLSVVLVFRVLEQDHDLLGTLQIAGASLANAVLVMSLTLGGFFLFSNLLNITTSLQLLELGRPNHPLLRELLLKAPGTYHHSLMVGNLAEQAAQAVGANPLLARVGAYYHDIGKSLRPYFFAENQTDGDNPHDRLDPGTSAQIVTSHVKDGMQLAKKYSLPQEIQDFIPQHHGSALSGYFFQQAREQGKEAQEGDEERFRYAGPKPQSREAAILMLADEVEAASRANRPRSLEEIEELVDRLVRHRVEDGQLDDSELTLADLQRIKETFVSVLQGIYHPRIRYPEDALEEEEGEKQVVEDRAERPDRPAVRRKARQRTTR